VAWNVSHIVIRRCRPIDTNHVHPSMAKNYPAPVFFWLASSTKQNLSHPDIGLNFIQFSGLVQCKDSI
jgi:hypothetical protein